MALAISAGRYRAIRAAVEARRMATMVAEVEAIKWDKLPQFASVDDFLTFLNVVNRSVGHPARSCRKRR
jgi:hypothetical protein